MPVSIRGREAVCPKEIEQQSNCIDSDIGKVFENLR